MTHDPCGTYLFPHNIGVSLAPKPHISDHAPPQTTRWIDFFSWLTDRPYRLISVPGHIPWGDHARGRLTPAPGGAARRGRLPHRPTPARLYRRDHPAGRQPPLGEHGRHAAARRGWCAPAGRGELPRHHAARTRGGCRACRGGALPDVFVYRRAIDQRRGSVAVIIHGSRHKLPVLPQRHGLGLRLL